MSALHCLSAYTQLCDLHPAWSLNVHYSGWPLTLPASQHSCCSLLCRAHLQRWSSSTDKHLDLLVESAAEAEAMHSLLHCMHTGAVPDQPLAAEPVRGMEREGSSPVWRRWEIWYQEELGSECLKTEHCQCA